MSDYIVSARKYRPSTFKTVVGQKSLTNTLKNAIDSKRLAQAYLFCGPRGVGKTSCARIFAKTINCLSPTADGEACGQCESCRSIDHGNSFNIIELDAASNNSVDYIRKLTEEVNIPPQVGDYRVFIIDEVHMLSPSAFNAFLKTLEEPPKYAVFILATTEKHKVIPTILSRCQIYDFKRITTADIVEHLAYVAKEERIHAETEALNVIARKADGAMRDALSIFDQVAASSMGNITYQSTLANLNVLDYDYYFNVVEAFRAGNVADSLLIFSEIIEKGFDTLFFINGLASHVRDLMVAADEKTSSLLEVAEEIKKKYSDQAKSLPLDWYYAALKIINDTDFKYRTATNKQLLTELMLIRLCQLLNPPTPPFDRVDEDIPLKKPVPIAPTVTTPPAPAVTAAPNTSDSAGTIAPAAAAPVVNASPAPTTATEHQVEKKDVATPATKTRGRKSTLKSTRLSELQKEVSGREEEKNRREKIDVADFHKVWSDFMENNGDKPLLVNAMRSGNPEMTGQEEFSIKVSHPAQQQAFETNISVLLNFLRDRLKNDFLALNVKIDDSQEIIKPMPAKELLKDIVETNPNIANILGLIDPELI